MPRNKKVAEKVFEKVEVPDAEIVIEKPKRGRRSKKVVPVATAEPVEESVPAPVPKKRVRKSKKVQEAPVVVEEVKVEEVKEVKTKKKPKALKVDNKASEPKPKRAKSKWLLHVEEYRKKNPGVSYRDCLKNAKASYSK